METHAHTNIYLVEQIRQKEDVIIALQRQVADIKKFFRTSTEQYFKDRKDIQQLLAGLKKPLQQQAGCPQCLSTQTELFVTQGKIIALREELEMLTTSQERTYLDMERLRQKHEVTIGQVADLRNTLNVYEDKTMIVADQAKRIDGLEKQIEHHLEDRVQLTMENHQLRRRLEEAEWVEVGGSGGGGGSRASGQGSSVSPCAGTIADASSTLQSEPRSSVGEHAV